METSTQSVNPTKVKKCVDVLPTLPDALQINDCCYAKFKSPVGELTWFVAKIIVVRKKLCDPVQVEFKRTLDGVSLPLLLPSPIRAWVDLWSIRRDVPHTVQLESTCTPLFKRACVRNKGDMNVNHLFKESIKNSKLQHAALYNTQNAPKSAIKKTKVRKPRFSSTLSLRKRRSDVPPPYTLNELGHMVVPESSVEIFKEMQICPEPNQTLLEKECSITSPKASSRGNTELEAAHGLLQMTPPHLAPTQAELHQPVESPIADLKVDQAAPKATPPVMASDVLKSHLIYWYMDKACVNTQVVCSRMPVWCLFCPMCGHAQQATV